MRGCASCPWAARRWGGAGKGLAALSELAEAGCVAISDDGSPVSEGSLMRNALTLAGALGLVVAEHCDEPSLSGKGAMHEGAISERLGLAGQPTAAESAAIARNIELCELTGGRLHIMHMTTARGVEQVGARERARAARYVRGHAESPVPDGTRR